MGSWMYHNLNATCFCDVSCIQTNVKRFQWCLFILFSGRSVIHSFFTSDVWFQVGFCPTQSSIPALCIRWVLMQTPKIVNFTVMATVGVAFLQQQLSDDTASRVRQFEQIVAACAAVLQFLGRPRFLDSLFQLWSGLTHSLILMEALLFPEQPVRTSSQLALPRENLPLSSIMDDRFQQCAPLIPLAIQSLAEHTDWFHEKYDKNLHKEMAALGRRYVTFPKHLPNFAATARRYSCCSCCTWHRGPRYRPYCRHRALCITRHCHTCWSLDIDLTEYKWQSAGDMPVEAAGYVFLQLATLAMWPMQVVWCLQMKTKCGRCGERSSRWMRNPAWNSLRFSPRCVKKGWASVCILNPTALSFSACAHVVFLFRVFMFLFRTCFDL